MKKFIALVIAALLTLGVVGCGGQNPPASNSPAAPASPSDPAPSGDASNGLTVLKVAASPAPHAEILNSVKDAMAAEGFDLQVVEYTDYIMPNNAVFNGEMDANYFQHQPYLTNFNEKNKTDLVAAAAIHFEPLGIYPGKTASLDALADGATIVVPNDPTNEARALNLLAAQGIITLKEGAGLAATVKDITDNPKNVKITEVEAAQVPMALPDYDFGVINGNYAVGTELSDSILVSEDPSSEAAQTFANIVAVKPGKENDAAIQALVKVLTSEDTRKFITEKYGVAVVPVF
ncbi:MAG: ABC transporter substrate-binding protein [Angelakisella sp.]|mgnify:FL=1|jgi:D-methionine transport system substrate-binding protein|nr:ABC transporter substrate-binding protein [Angelakisella sp.]